MNSIKIEVSNLVISRLKEIDVGPEVGIDTQAKLALWSYLDHVRPLAVNYSNRWRMPVYPGFRKGIAKLLEDELLDSVSVDDLCSYEVSNLPYNPYRRVQRILEEFRNGCDSYGIPIEVRAHPGMATVGIDIDMPGYIWAALDELIKKEADVEDTVEEFCYFYLHERFKRHPFDMLSMHDCNCELGWCDKCRHPDDYYAVVYKRKRKRKRTG